MALNVRGPGTSKPRGHMFRWRAACIAGLALLPLVPAAHAQAVSPPVKLYIFAGQSNMVGYSTKSAELPAVDPSLTAPAARVRFWGPVQDYAGQWATLQAPTEILQPASHSGFGPELSAAQMLAGRYPRATIGIVKLARNGTDLAWDWSPANRIGLYLQLMDRVRVARRALQARTGSPVEIAGFFWMQGEAEALWKRGADAYTKNLTNFIGSARRDLNAPNMPFVIGRIADLKRINKVFKWSDEVRRSQETVDRSVARTFLVSTDGVERDQASPFHFSTRGTVQLGRRFANRTIPL
jgi:hypothetical protein